MYTRIRLVSKSMTLNDLWARFKVIDSLNAAKMAKYSLVMTPTPCRVAECIIFIRPTYLCTRSLTYLFTYLHSCFEAYKTRNISETVEDRAKVTINGTYKVEHGLSIAVKMYDLIWMTSARDSRSLIWFLKCLKNCAAMQSCTPWCCCCCWLRRRTILVIKVNYY